MNSKSDLSEVWPQMMTVGMFSSWHLVLLYLLPLIEIMMIRITSRQRQRMKKIHPMIPKVLGFPLPLRMQQLQQTKRKITKQTKRTTKKMIMKIISIMKAEKRAPVSLSLIYLTISL